MSAGMSTLSSSRCRTYAASRTCSSVGAPLVDHRLDLGVLARVERLEREVFELPLHLVDPEPVRERRVHLERLARLLHLLLLAEVLDRPEVVEPVGELDEDDPEVLGHRQDHLPVVLRLGLLPALEADARQLRDAVDELRDLVAELGLDVVERGVGVLDDVVEQRRGDRLVVELELCADACDRVGWWMNSSPERRCWPSWAPAAKRNARVIRSRSRSGLYSATSAMSSLMRS